MPKDALGQTRAIWQGMKQRCRNQNNPAYPYYGGRGIKVCERWLESFQNFLDDMGPRPAGRSIDRINNDGDYEPSNCRWATTKEQSVNKRPGGFVKDRVEATHCVHGHELTGSNLYITARGRRHCVECQRAINVAYRIRRKERERANR